MTEVNTSKQEFESAIAALSEYGFPKGLIKRTLKDILRVYNGNEGWPLIKENGYEVVIERIISDDGKQQRKSQRQDGMQTCGHSEHAKEDRMRSLDPAASDKGGLDNGNSTVVETNRGSPSAVTPTLGGYPFADTSPVADVSRDSSLFVQDVENLNIYSHQRKSWTRGGSFPTPPWLRILHASRKRVPQKFSHLCALLKSLDKDSTTQAGKLENHSITSFEFKNLKEEKIEYEEESLKKGYTNSCKGNVIKDEEEVKAQKGEVSPICIAETCNTATVHSQQELNPQVLRALDSADVPHIQHDTNHTVFNPTGIKQRKFPAGQSRKRVLVSQEFCEKTSEPVTAVQSKRPREESATNKANNLQSTFEAAERLDIARMSAFKLTRRRDGGPNPMFSRLQKCKQAGAGASISQNNNQGSSVFSQCRCGEAISDSWTEPILQKSQQISDLPPGCWDSSASCGLQAHSIPDRAEEVQDQSPAQESPELPPGFEEPFVSSPESPRLPPGFWEPCGRRTSQEHILDSRCEDTRDSVSPEESPSLPPGFSEPYDPFCSEGTPTLPPGVWEPPDSDHDPGSEDCNSEERTSSHLSPDLPPGFWKSPDWAAGLSSPSVKSMGWKSISLQETRSPSVSPEAPQDRKEGIGNHSKNKGTPPKQVFIANIPSGLEGAEQKLYNLVREMLGGFKSVPISATLPRKIQVTDDHAFVEFCCEAMAGIFMDAYHADASVLRINGEQLLAARSLKLMKMDIQLRHAIAERLKGEVLDLGNVFYLGNVPPKWQNERKLFAHISVLLEGECIITSKTLSVYTIPNFSDVYIHISSSLLAETFFLRCLSEKEHLEEISASLFVCRNLKFLPRAAKVSLG